MPEIWVNLNIDEELVPEVHGLDMRDFYGRDAEAVLRALKLKTLDEMHTETFDEWQYYYETIPEQHRQPWNPDNEEWTPASYGIEWADRLREHLDSLSDFGNVGPTRAMNENSFLKCYQSSWSLWSKLINLVQISEFPTAHSGEIC